MKTINLEIQVPDWVEWIAQDANGKWCGYDVRPSKGPPWPWHEWICRGDKVIELTDPLDGAENPNWQQSLRKV